MLLVLVLSFSFVAYAQLLVGDPCIDTTNGIFGTCKALEDCGHLRLTVLDQKPYTSCGFVGPSEIVCCHPNEESPLDDDPSSLSSTTSSSAGDQPIRRISELKCSEYAKNIKATSEVTAARIRSVIETDLCGHTISGLIVGGVDANEREFPHMALLGYGYGDLTIIDWNCGGTLISDEYVLTAAHCIYYGDLRRIRLGDHDHTQENRNRQEFGVVQTIVHPLHDVDMDYFDIALVQLDRQVTFNAYILPACLPRQSDYSEKKAIATGWGASSFSAPRISTLQKVTLDMFTDRECKEAYKDIDILPEGVNSTQQICAGSYTKRMDTCQGDSGGPLQIYRLSDYCMYTVIGVTSAGRYCGTEGVPGIYQKIYPHLDWIENILWQNDN